MCNICNPGSLNHIYNSLYSPNLTLLTATVFQNHFLFLFQHHNLSCPRITRYILCLVLHASSTGHKTYTCETSQPSSGWTYPSLPSILHSIAVQLDSAPYHLLAMFNLFLHTCTQYCHFWHYLCRMELIGSSFSWRACYIDHPSIGFCETPSFSVKRHHLTLGCDQTEQHTPSIFSLLSLRPYIILFCYFTFFWNVIFFSHLFFLCCSLYRLLACVTFTATSPSSPPTPPPPPLHHLPHHHHPLSCYSAWLQWPLAPLGNISFIRTIKAEHWFFRAIITVWWVNLNATRTRQLDCSHWWLPRAIPGVIIHCLFKQILDEKQPWNGERWRRAKRRERET